MFLEFLSALPREKKDVLFGFLKKNAFIDIVKFLRGEGYMLGQKKQVTLSRQDSWPLGDFLTFEGAKESIVYEVKNNTITFNYLPFLKKILNDFFKFSMEQHGVGQSTIQNIITPGHYSVKIYNKLLAGGQISYPGWFALILFWAYNGDSYELIAEKLQRIPSCDIKQYVSTIKNAISKKMKPVTKKYLEKHKLL
jgi:hypothetical protein